MSTTTMQAAPPSGGGFPAPGREPGPRPGANRRRHLLTLAVAITLTLLTLPAFGTSPGDTHDASWVAAMHVAAHRRMQFGSELAFTYGPLGFLTLPIPYFAATWGLSVAYIVLLRLALCVALAATLRRAMGLPVAMVAAFVVAAASRDLGPAELALALFVAASVRLLSRDHAGSRRLEQWAVVLLGALAGMHLLVKLNTGVFMVLIGATTAWMIGRLRWRSEVVFGASAAATLLTGWTLTGHHLSGLSLYFQRSWQVAAGYSEAMGMEQARRAPEYAVALLVVIVVAVLAYDGSRHLGRRRRAAIALVVATWLFVGLKHGFVRHDGHSGVFFGEALVVGVFLARATARRRETLVLVGLLVVSLLAVGFEGSVKLGHSRPDPVATAQDAYRLLQSDGLRSEAAGARAALQRAYGLDPRTLQALAGHTVHIHPWDAGVAWAYPQIDWQPVPVFQAYSAYTSGLDAANATALRGAGAPQRILAAWKAIDGRSPAWESPEAMRVMACNYAELRTQGPWQVLARVPNRCGAEQPIATVKASAGDTVPVPPASGGDTMTVARVRGLDSTPLYRLRAQLTKIPAIHAVVDGTIEYRLVPGTAGNGLVLAAPAHLLGWSAPFAFASSATTLRIVGEGIGVGHHLEIEFTAIPVARADLSALP
jgi:hypothetical protein